MRKECPFLHPVPAVVSATAWTIRAKLEQNCQECGERIELDDWIVKRPGIGWCHKNGKCEKERPGDSPTSYSMTPNCPVCGSKMVIRNLHTSKPLWGCSQYESLKAAVATSVLEAIMLPLFLLLRWIHLRQVGIHHLRMNQASSSTKILHLKPLQRQLPRNVPKPKQRPLPKVLSK